MVDDDVRAGAGRAQFARGVEGDAERVFDPMELVGYGWPDQVTLIGAERSALADGGGPRQVWMYVNETHADRWAIRQMNVDNAIVGLSSEMVLVSNPPEDDATLPEENLLAVVMVVPALRVWRWFVGGPML
jgi:hypothetical protein